MLARPFRLSRSETTLVLKTGRLYDSQFLRVRVKTSQGIKEPRTRFAILVPNGSASRSSARQRIKRRTRHIISQLLPEIKPGQAIVIILKKATAVLNFEKLREKITEIFHQAKII